MPVRRAAAVALTLVVAGCAAGVLGVLGGWREERALEAVATLACTVVLLGSWLVVRARAGAPADDRLAWASLAQGTAVAAGSGLVALVASLAGGAVTAVQVGVVGLGLVHHLLVYRGLVHLNHARTSLIGTGDWLNGLGSILVAVAAGNLLTGLLAPSGWNGWTWWELQSWLVPTCGLLVVIGTLVTIAHMTGSGRDWRVLVMLACGLLVLSGSGVVAALGLSPWALPPVLPALPLSVLLACFSLTPERRIDPAPGSTQATTVGAFVVGATAIAVLVVGTRLGPERSLTPVAFAGAALVGVAVRVVVTIRDLTQLATTRRQALTDDLTDLPNRRAFTAQLRQTTDAAVLTLDLDRFKDVNDRFGRRAGDALLRELAFSWAGALPPGAVLARLSGDEFAVLLPGGDVSAAQVAARELVRVLTSVGADNSAHLRASIGITGTAQGLSAEEVLRRADAARYLVKVSGLGIGVYDDEVDRAERDRVELAEDLVEALTGPRREVEFVVHYQPQVCVRTGHLNGVEALVRWQHPRRGLLLPGGFLELVETQRLMPHLTEHVLRSAVAQQREWLTQGLPVRLSVNLSASCLEHPDLVALLDSLAPAGELVVEVTETTLMGDPEVALATCRRIVRHGYGLSIDDYGTGYSSMSYLAVLPATELKVDKSFVAQVENPRMRSIVATTVELAHRLGMRVVAEGVETPGHLAAVRELGCDESQGYLQSRPLSAAGLLQWSRERQGQASVAVSMTNR